ncbi:MAG: hypothetical protein JNJ77_21175 [Planctomycetia bacterium]|nr:hypothetical protein [Planctomycetia bacterium]
MPDDKNQPMGWRGGKKPARQPKYGWKPASQGPSTSWWMRRTTQLSLLLGIFMCVAVIVVLILKLGRQDAATIILVGVNPAEVARNLETPLDLHGWLGGLKLANWINSQNAEQEQKSSSFLAKWWGRKNLEVKLDGKSGKPYSLNNNTLRDVFDQIEVTPGVVIVYFGMLGLTENSEPMLFGADDKIPVNEILNRLEKVANQRKEKDPIILLFDAARIDFHPETGMMHNGFVRALQNKNMKERIEKIPHCAIICSSSPGETAWNSDEFGSSVFLAQVLEALQGNTRNSNQEPSLTLAGFFEDVKKQTSDWTSKRFVNGQTPIMLSGNGVDSSKVVLVEHGENTTKAEGKPNEDSSPIDWKVKVLEQLEHYHQKEQDLVKKSPRQSPRPEVYTPVHWQRYRALVQRLQQCLRLSNQDAKDESYTKAVQIISDELNTLITAMEKARERIPKNVEKTSLVWNNYYEKPESRKIAANTILENVEKLGAPPATVEEHLAWMLNKHGVKNENDKQRSLSLRALAVETRYLAERATFGVSEFPGFLYSERIWPLISMKVRKADELRRQGEDLLFTHDYEKAEQQLKDAKDSYQKVLKVLPRLQKALSVYHRAVSEATCLTQFHMAWMADSTNSYKDEVQNIKDLWKQIHNLNSELNTILYRQPNDIKSIDATEEKWKSLDANVLTIEKQLKEQYELFAKAFKDLDLQQKGRYRRELLLSFPWPLDDDAKKWTHLRNTELKELLNISQKLHKANNEPYKGGESKNSIQEIVKQRFSMQFARLGGDKDTELRKLQQTSNWESIADALASSLASEFQQQRDKVFSKNENKDAVSKQVNSAGSVPTSENLEDFSRFTLRLRPLDQDWKEPALANRERLWTDLLHAQAYRICLDHWYNDNKPYFQTIAQICLDDAPVKRDPEKEIQEMMKNSGKSLSFTNHEESILWTSELTQDRSIEVKKELPDKIQGKAALWVDEPIKDEKNSAKSSISLEGGVKRRAIDLNKLKLDFKLKGDPINLDDKTQTLPLTFNPRLFFRGWQEKSDLTVVVNRQPKLIVSELPKEQRASFSVISDTDLKIGLGHLAIVMDYSGSMDLSPDDKEKAKRAGLTERQFDSRKNKAVHGLAALLNNLPEGVNISIRIFSDSRSAPWTKTDFINKYGENYEKKYGEITQTIPSWLFCRGSIKRREDDKRYFSGEVNEKKSQDDNEYKSKSDIPISDLIDYLLDLPPRSFTPLIKSMETCLEEDIRKSAKGTEDVTMLVLTDGADSSSGLIPDKMNAEEEEKIVEKISEKIKRIFKEHNVCLRIVYFNDASAVTTSREWKVAEKQFECIRKFKNPGDIVLVSDPANLIKSLNETLCPKILLTKNNDGGNGKPFNPKSYSAPRLGKFDDLIHELSPGNYESSVWTGHEQAITFSSGDHLFIKLLNDQNNKVKYSRELFAHYWKDQPRFNKDQYEMNPLWHLMLTDISQTNEANSYTRRRMTTTLEKTFDQPIDGSRALRQHKPFFVWWDVKAINNGKEEAAAGTVHISNKGYYLAPAWDIDQCPKEDKILKLNAWVFDDNLKNREPLSFKISDLNPRSPYELRKGKPELLLSREHHYLIDKCQTRSASKVDCLVLRVMHDEGKRYYFKVISGIDAKRVDHHYFDKATTVYFSPLLESLLEEKSRIIHLEMMDISAAMQDKKEPTIGITVPKDITYWRGPELPAPQNAEGSR